MRSLLRKLKSCFIYILFKLNPKKDVIMFHSEKFRDSVKFVYDYIRDKADGYRIIWCFSDQGVVEDLRSRGIEAVYAKSFSYIFLCSRLKMIISSNLCDLQDWLYINPIKMSIFHGFGTKETPAKWEFENPESLRYKKQVIRNLDYLVCLDSRDESYFLPKDKLKIDDKYPVYLPFGLPRNDMLLEGGKRDYFKGLVCKKFEIDEKKSLVLYAPTWREAETGVNAKGDFWFFNDLDTKILAEYLMDNNYVLLLRPHHFLLKDKEFVRGINELTTKYKEVFKLCGADIWPETQELLCASDILITDYSSIFVDYILTQRPIMFLDIDTEEYVNQRGLVIDYYLDMHTPGPKFKNVDEAIVYFEEVKNGSDRFVNARAEALNYYHDFSDGKSTERVGDFILNLLKK